MSGVSNYKNKIQVLVLYFGISEDAAKYMFHRRRRGYPFKKEDDKNYLAWTTKLQNAIIDADKNTDIDWNDIKFGEDVKVLDTLVGIDNKSKTVTLDKVKQTNCNLTRKGRPSSVEKIYNKDLTEGDDDGWTVVTNGRNKVNDKNLLRKMGFLPR